MNIAHPRPALRWLITVGFILGLGAWVQAQEQLPVSDRNETALLNDERAPSYWLGIECFPAEDALRAQLGLGDETGLLIASIMPDSPADKAGLQRHDVLIGAAVSPQLDGSADQTPVPVVWTPLRHQGDLASIVRDANGAPVWIKLLRRGEEQLIVVTPVRRKERDAPQHVLDQTMNRWRQIVEGLASDHPLPPHVERDIRHWASRLGVGLPGFHGDVIVARPQILLDSPLPDDMTVTVTKTGNQPSKLIVRKGEQTWEITEDKLSDLPDEVRQPVEKMLGGWASVPEEARRALRELRLPTPSREQRESLRILERQARSELEQRLAEARQAIDDARNSPEAQELLQEAEQQYEALKRKAATESNKLEADIRRSIEERMQQVEVELEHLRQSPALQRKIDELNGELERVKQVIEELQKKASQVVE